MRDNVIELDQVGPMSRLLDEMARAVIPGSLPE
jgi:hypothetical protein